MLSLQRENLKKVSVKPILNKRNGQINFSIKKTSLPKDIKDKLPKLKSIRLRMEDFKFL